MNGYECNRTNIFIRWKMECSIQRGGAELNGTFHLSPNENIRSIARMKNHSLFVLYNTQVNSIKSAQFYLCSVLNWRKLWGLHLSTRKSVRVNVHRAAGRTIYTRIMCALCTLAITNAHGRIIIYYVVSYPICIVYIMTRREYTASHCVTRLSCNRTKWIERKFNDRALELLMNDTWLRIIQSND